MRTRSTTSRQNRSFLPAAASCRVRLLRAVRRTARAPGSPLQVYEAAKESVAEGSLVPFKAALDSGCGINATVRGCAHAKHGMGGERQTRGTWHAGAAVSAGRGVVAGGGRAASQLCSDRSADVPKGWVGPIAVGVTQRAVSCANHSYRRGWACRALLCRPLPMLPRPPP